MLVGEGLGEGPVHAGGGVDMPRGFSKVLEGTQVHNLCARDDFYETSNEVLWNL